MVNASGTLLFLPLARNGKKLLEDACHSLNTKSSTTQWVTTFELYCRSKKTEVNYSTIELADVAVLFQSFYADLSQKDDEQYCINSLMAHRSALY